MELTYKKIVLLSVFLFLSAASARPLSWSEAVELVKQNNPDLMSAQKNLESTQSLQNTTYSGFLPKLSASLYENQSHGEQTSFSRSYGAQLNLTQNIFGGFSDVNKKHMFEANTSVAIGNFKIQQAAVSSELKQAYETVLFAQNFKKLTSDIIARRKDNLKNVQLQFQSGRENKGSVLLSESYVEQALYDDLSAQHQYETAEENLKRILGVLGSEELILVESERNLYSPQIAEASGVSVHNKNQPDFVQLAAASPDVLVSQFQEKSSLFNYEVSKAQFFPSLDLNGTYGNYDTVFFPEQNKWSIGLTLSIPLFDGAKDYFTSKSNYLKYEAARIVAQDKLNQVQIKLKQAYYDYSESVQKEKVDESFNRAAEVRAQIARSKYKNGLMSFDDWDLVESDLIQRQKSWLASRKDRVVKYALWEQAQGVGVLNEKK